MSGERDTEDVVNAADYGLAVTNHGHQNRTALQLACDAAAHHANPLLPRDFTLPTTDPDSDD